MIDLEEEEEEEVAAQRADSSITACRYPITLRASLVVHMKYEYECELICAQVELAAAAASDVAAASVITCSQLLPHSALELRALVDSNSIDFSDSCLVLLPPAALLCANVSSQSKALECAVETHSPIQLLSGARTVPEAAQTTYTRALLATPPDVREASLSSQP